MIKLNGYQVNEKIHQSEYSVIYKGFSDAKGKKVIIKMLNANYPGLKEVEKLKREFETIQKLNIPEVVQPIAIEHYNNGPVLILEDFNGQPIDNLADRFKRDLPFFLTIAIELAAALGKIHKNKIIHKDIKPGNILINPENNDIKIIDFGHSSMLEKENQVSVDPQFLEGTLEYMSPEQTGRMNRAIDFRTDFYSLGITFYELLCGRLPFTSDDPLELVHCHIAQQPPDLKQFNTAIPDALCKIVFKLLKKNAEERYQGAFGLLTDLTACEEALKAGADLTGFVPGEFDTSENLRIPQKLYGRQKEISELTAAFNSVAEGQPELVLISGFSGIGKTVLVNDLQKSVVVKRGYFITGKFDQFKRNIPYASPVQAFKELIRKLLTESEARLQYWRDELTNALGANAQLMIGVIPELELLIGAQPEVTPLGPTESQNRFNITFQSFVKVFTAKNNPLVIFLDDLQWADQGSLDFIKSLMNDKDAGSLLLIGSYRNNEISAGHPLTLTIDEIKGNSIPVKELFLNPLAINDISLLVAETFSCLQEKALELAALIEKKTGGNPFFINEFIKTLYANGNIEFNSAKGIWQWDIDSIGRAGITDNVIELMADKIKKLKPRVQELLKVAACLGNSFGLKAIAQINKESARHTEHQLLPAIEAGLIIPLGNDYKLLLSRIAGTDEDENNLPQISFSFIHDRIQQAAYSLIEEDKKKDYHLRIGRQLLLDTNEETREASLFDIVNHFNYSANLVTDKAEKIDVARLNLQAGEKAKFSSAFLPALKYFSSGVAMLDKQDWETNYQLCYNLYIELAECEHLCGNIQAAEDYFALTLANATSVADKAGVYEKKVHFYSNLSKFLESYEAGRSALRLFKINLPAPQSAKPLLILEFLKSKIKLRGKKIENLVNLPEMEDKDLRMAVKLISALLKSAYQVSPELCVANAIKIVNISVSHGNTPENAIAFIVFGGIFQGGVLGQHETGYKFGKLALSLNDKFNFVSQKPEVNFVFGYFSNSWKNPVKDTEEYYKTALKAGLEIGDFFHTGCALAALSQSMLMRGLPLEEVYTNASKYLELAKQIQNKEAEGSIEAVLQTIRNYKGLTKSRLTFEDDNFVEADYLEKLKKFGSQHLAHFYFINRMQSLYLWGEYQQALEVANESKKYLDYSIGMVHMTEHHFYHALILCGLANSDSLGNKKKYLRKAKGIQNKFKKWAIECPENYLHKELLLNAELAKLSGARPDEWYNLAIDGAKNNGFIQNAAIAAELAANYCFSKNDKEGNKYIADSWHLFNQWGAVEKTAKMKTDYSYLQHGLTANEVAGNNAPAKKQSTSGSFNSGGNFEKLDILSVFKASQALSGEVVLERLLKKLMSILVENAGANRGVLIIKRNGRFFIEAEHAPDKEEIIIHNSTALNDESLLIPAAVFNYVVRTNEYIVLNDAVNSGDFTYDNYINNNKPKSVLCAPLVSQGKLISVIYLENNLTTDAFTKDRLEVLLILASQAAISIENSLLYENLESKVQERTVELTEAKKKVDLANIEITKEKEVIQQTLKELKLTQNQLIQAEKMASLGELTAGIAHEIQNPLNFINNFSEVNTELIDELQQEIEKNNFEDVIAIAGDIKQNQQKINEHGKRADFIVKGMLQHSRSTAGERQPTNMNILSEEFLKLSYQGLRAKDKQFNADFSTHFEQSLPKVNVIQQDMGRVLLNLFNNAFYAVAQKQKTARKDYRPEVCLTTFSEDGRVIIKVKDNGDGIPEGIRDKILQPFFTTKPTGEGTGLGLSLSYDMVVKGHGGQLNMNTVEGEFTEFEVVLPMV